MIFAFTVAADAGLVWLLASAVAIAKFDTWGDRLIPVARAAAVTGRGRQLHVGVDAHDLTPVPLRWVEDQISRPHDKP
ncbi:hypothetical protein IU443_28480 [Nocardia farcinica]|uniref:hypothetical protein n=1 Tax=Nocardia farcinica TaxID=37329 RepID=UPI001892F7B9|nr:hypothetical protein [Nocardia farcinica]MBF6393869.1 hypothetical protein [Nocardia farcinica]